MKSHLKCERCKEYLSKEYLESLNPDDLCLCEKCIDYLFKREISKHLNKMQRDYR